MKHLRSFWRSIPRPVHCLVTLLLCAMLAVLLYIVIGSPVLSIEHALRRAEKLHLVGPSEILDTLDRTQCSEYEHLILGKTDHGYVFYGQRHVTDASDFFQREIPQYTLTYQKKSGDVDFLAAPSEMNAFWPENLAHTLPIYVMDDYPQAVHAELKIISTGTYWVNVDSQILENEFCGEFTLQAQREKDGFFRFFLQKEYVPHDSDSKVLYASPELHTMHLLSNLCSGMRIRTGHVTDGSVSLTVRLYDASENLIKEATQTFTTEETDSP